MSKTLQERAKGRNGGPGVEVCGEYHQREKKDDICSSRRCGGIGQSTNAAHVKRNETEQHEAGMNYE